MMSLRKNMNLKKVCLTAGCLLAVGMVSLAESNAGVIPWTYNAIFGPSRNGPMYAGAAPQSYSANYGGYGMMGSGSCCGAPGYTAYYGGGNMGMAPSRRSTRAAYRWYLINNPQVVGVNYQSFAGGNSSQFASVAYGPGCCSACDMGGCSTGSCGAGGCSTGQCGVSYNPATASTPTPDPNSGSKVPAPREVQSTTPKTFAEEPMTPGKTSPGVEDSGFESRRYDRAPMDTPMPKSGTEDLFKEPLKRDAVDLPMPGTKPAQPDFGTETPEPGTEKKQDDFFGTGESKAFKPTPDGKFPKTAIPQKKAAPTPNPGEKAPKAEQETNLPPLRVQPLNLDQKITWKSAPRAERLTIRANFSAPVVAKQDVPANSGWFAITDSAKIASK
ncbi:MAG: hypothetical protein ABIK07_18040 [Planctomycetota bacterium]